MRAILSKLLFAAALSLGAALAPGAAMAHALTDSEVIVERREAELRLFIRAPLEDLALAMPDAPDARSALSDSEEAALRAYFARHTRIFTEAGGVPVEIVEVRLIEAHHGDVGAYGEVQVVASAPVATTAGFTLRYDGILHQVANHRALVYASDGTRLGILRFDLSLKAPNALDLGPAAKR